MVSNQAMFIRLIAIAERIDKVENVFKYELTAEPMALFKGGFMRKADKSSLRKILVPSTTMIRDRSVLFINYSFNVTTMFDYYDVILTFFIP